MRKDVIEEIEVTRKESITKEKIVMCNKCGCESKGVDRDNFYDSQFQNIDCSFGYGSDYDMEAWNFDLCEECLVEFIKTFKHVPDGFKLDSHYMIIKDRSEHQKVFNEWKATDNWEELRFKTYEELMELAPLYDHNEYINELISKYHTGKPLLQD
ncbi:hypothetical protein [Priestia megaterium]|uniref:hypothetical protein n=1 Tax=Priestia megaterium TaxID=1404 RepID=UPI001126E948|nr:hypothetical protein [Priestia megaterium]TPF18077.1 hypothetical protein CBE78_02285 [Priestia megaterium]TPF22184.1 hypothetical protein CBE79_04790 [Priestia megaterium]